MTGEWRWSMDNLRDACYLVQLVTRQILIFLRDFIFYEFTWFTPTEDNFDNVSPKIRNIAPQPGPVTDFIVLLAVCGLLLAFMILSVTSPKDEVPGYEMTGRIESVPTTFENEATPFWTSRPTNLPLVKCHHAGDSVDSGDVVVEARNILQPTASKTSISAARPRFSEHNARTLNHPRHRHPRLKTRTSRLVVRATPREWLLRRTRSGHVYGKYPV